MGLRAGRLDKRVEVWRKTLNQDPETGEEIEVWILERNLMMGKRDVSASERFSANQEIAEISTVFTARWHPGAIEIRPDTHRLRHRGRDYDIQGPVREIGREDGIEFAAKARAEAQFGE